MQNKKEYVVYSLDNLKPEVKKYFKKFINDCMDSLKNNLSLVTTACINTTIETAKKIAEEKL